MPTTLVAKYQMMADIVIQAGSGTIAFVSLPIRKCKIEYRVNDVPKAVFSTPLAIICYANRSIPDVINDPTVFPNWPIMWKNLLKLNPCTIRLGVSIMGGGNIITPVFNGYVYSASLAYTNDEAFVEFNVVSRLIDAGFGSVSSGMIHPSSPVDFSNQNLFLGVPTIQQYLTMQLPSTSGQLLQSILMYPFRDVGATIKQVITILLTNPTITNYAAQKLTQWTGMPVLPFVGQTRALNSINRMFWYLIMNDLFVGYIPVYGYGFAEVLTQATVGTDLTSWTNSTLFARLLDLGATFDFIIAPSYAYDAYILPNNPISPMYRFIFSPRDYIAMRLSGEIRQDIRGVVLIGEGQLPFSGSLLSKETYVTGYYDEAWFNFPNYNRDNMSGSLLIVPAPAWMKASSLTDAYIKDVDAWLQTFQQRQNPVTGADPLSYESLKLMYWNSAYQQFMTLLGTLVAGSLFHKLAYETRKMVVTMPLVNAVKYYGRIPGPGTIALVQGYDFLHRVNIFRNNLALIGQIASFELNYDVHEKNASISFSISHVRSYEEIRNWIATGFPYGSHPLWKDPPLGYLNTIP